MENKYKTTIIKTTYISALLAGAVLVTLFTASCTPYGNPTQTSQTTSTITTTVQPTTPTTTTSIPGIENVMSKAQIKTTMEDILSSDLSSQSPVTDYTRAVWQKAEAVNQSVYYYLTGRTFEQDKLVTRVFTYDEKFIPDFPPYYLNADGTPNVAGTASPKLPDGTTKIFVVGNPTPYNTDGYNSARTFVLLLANETGNASDLGLLTGGGDFKYIWKWEDVKTKDNGIIGAYINIYEEASKKAYQGAFARFLEEIGVNLSVVDTQSNRENISEGEESMRLNFENLDIPQKGWYLMWAMALENPEIKNEIEQNHQLSSASSMKLHDIILKDLVTHPDFIEQAQGKIKPSLGLDILQCIYNQLVPNGKIKEVLSADLYWFFRP